MPKPVALRLSWIRATAVVLPFAVLTVLAADALEDRLDANAAQPPAFSRIVVVVMENREVGQVIGNDAAPYINGLAHRYALAEQFYAIRHPSLPNYLALLGGSTFGHTDDCSDCDVSAWNLVDQLEAHGVSWKAYMEGMPSACYQGGDTGRYVVHHNPFLYFNSIDEREARCHKVVPLRQLGQNVSSGQLPKFVWITPDDCHNGHDCSIDEGDEFLRHRLPPLLNSLGSNGILILTWDEGITDAGCCRYAHGGHIVTIVAGPGAGNGVSSNVRYSTYSILRTIEDAWGFRELRGAACDCTRPLSALIR